MRHSYGARLNKLQIRPSLGTDIELLRQWRNDEFVSKYLRKISYISLKQQKEWYKTYLSQRNIYYWPIVEENRVIGALSIYNIDKKTAEIGKIMIGSSVDRGKGYGYQSFLMA